MRPDKRGMHTLFIFRGNMSKVLKKTVFSALCLALCLILPTLTGHIPVVGKMLCPMHLPVLLCGFICGMPYGALVGLIAPLLKMLLTGTPVLYPDAVCISVELMSYGFFAGLFYKILPKNTVCLYISLICAMLAGRLVWGVTKYLLLLNGEGFGLGAFWIGGFVKAAPGIAMQLILIPLLVLALRKSKLVN